MALSLVNCFDSFDDEDVFHRFKLSRPCINFITDCISIRMKETQTQIKGLSASGMVMAALDYYSNGVVSTSAQDKARLHLSETDEIISIISKVISGMMNDLVTFPKTCDARANVANELKSLCGIPDVLGVVACLHVRVRPAPEDLEVFRNAQGFFSVMTQVICDCEGNFLSVEGCRVGSTPEQSIWESSAIGEQFLLGAHGSNWILDVQQLSLPEFPQIKMEQDLWTSQGAADVHQLSLPEPLQIKEEQGVWTSQDGAGDQQLSLPELPQIKEEQDLWTSQGGEQFQGLQSDITNSICTYARVKPHCDTEDSSQLLPLDHTPTVENEERDYLPANTTENQTTAEPEEDYGSPESASDSKPLSGTPGCPTAHSLEEEREGLLHGLRPLQPIKSRRKQAKCSKPPLSYCSSPDTCLMTQNSHSPCTKPISSSHSCTESDNVSTEEAETKTEDKRHHCKECDKVFNHKTSLVRHKKIHTAEKPYQCSICHKVFSKKNTLLKHRRIHKGKKPYQCEECDKVFLERAHFVTHRRIHTGERPYQCEECGQAFTQKAHAVKHRKMHTEEKSYQCQECGDNFNSQGNLLIHKRIHAREKPYRCEECDKAFREMSDLFVHRRIHTGERPQFDESGEAFNANSTC